MITDISKSIKATLYERASSPLFGSFALSWLIWNYKTILVIVSSLKVKEKIAFLESLYPDIISTAFSGFIFPLVSAILFILVYPIPAKWIYEYWNKNQKELKIIKQRIEDETPLTIEESKEIRRELYKLESEFESELTKKSIEIDRLKEQIDGLSNTINPSRKKLAR